MKNTLMLAGGLLVCALVRVASSGASPVARPVMVDIKTAAGQSVGTATLTDAAPGVRIKLDIRSLPPGEPSIHIHQMAKCEPPDLQSAEPHFSGAAAARHAGARAA